MDKYDRAIECLRENPEQIFDAWNENAFHPAGCLFQFCGSKFECGCLTQVHARTHHAATDELTEEICGDTRIPDNPREITLDDLPVFAEWQRKLDVELKRG